MIILSIICLFGAHLKTPADPIPVTEFSESRLVSEPAPFFRPILETVAYLGAAELLRSASLLSKLGWGICKISPWAPTIGNEFYLTGKVFESSSKHLFSAALKRSAYGRTPMSQSSWQLNHWLLSQIPVSSYEEEKLLHFLKNRWLAKSTGFYSFVINWVCPCFGISLQVHPETTNSYARDPSNKLSQTYHNRVEEWKRSLPHPKHFPLILTRPYDLKDYLPSYLPVPQDEKIQTTLERLALEMQKRSSKVVVDLTSVFADDTKDPKKWLQTWDAYQVEFSKFCKGHNQVLFIQRVKKDEIGGIRLLPLSSLSTEQINRQYQFLLEWISKFGLSANRVELDRWSPSLTPPIQEKVAPCNFVFEQIKEFASFIEAFDLNWKSDHPQKNLMVKGTLQVLKGLLASITEKKWKEMASSAARLRVAKLSFSKIEEQLNLLKVEKEDALFFDTLSHIELIHSDLSALLETFDLFDPSDFPEIYKNLLTCIPQNLKRLTSTGIHSTGMTSLTGIFKAAGKLPRVLYGENTYFENIHAANMTAIACPILQATDLDWKEADLILAQFNPVLKRIDFHVSEYKVENISDTLHKALNSGREKPLTLGLDCTLDYINSPRVEKLLTEFQEEIEKGALNVVCYRSGLKFDLFGMDNYSAAPFYMIHNQDAKWAAFDRLSTDPVLQTDRLSLNWFCLAYQSAAPYLELYRKQIFSNTRDFLNKIPSRLMSDKDVRYRIVPVDGDADPAFVDIKIYGPLHEIRGSLIGGLLSLKCLEQKLPMFNRPSIGFYHPNFCLLFSEECSTIRLTFGLEPSQVDLLTNCFKTIDSLNGTL